MTKHSKNRLQVRKGYTFERLDPNSEAARKIAADPYFLEKDRRAKERLKDCPITKELIEKMLLSGKDRS